MSISNNYAAEKMKEGSLLEGLPISDQIKDDIFDAIEVAHEDGMFNAITCCNSEYAVIFQNMYTEFINLKRINKIDMKRILTHYAEINLGDEINPYLEEE